MGIKFEKINKYDSSVQDAMYLWGLHGKKYRTLVSEYNELLDRKRELGIALQRISEKELKNFPEIEFLYIEGEVEAKEYLADRSPKEISRLCREITNMVETDYVYRTLCSKVEDFRAQIRKKTEPQKISYGSGMITRPTSNLCKRTCKKDD